MMPVKKSSLGLQDLVTSANDKKLSSIYAIIKLIVSIMEVRAFSTVDHILVLREERCDGKKIRDGNKLKVLVGDLKSPDLHIILISKNTGSCMNVWGTKVTGTVLLAAEFRDFCVHVMMLSPIVFLMRRILSVLIRTS